MKRRQASEVKFLHWRFYLVVLLLLMATVGILLRMIQLSVWQRDFLQSQGNARSLRTLTLAAYRGLISDRNGHPLAISSPVDTIWANPQQVDLQQPKLAILAKLLGGSTEKLIQQLSENQQREFIYLKRHLSPELGQQILDLDIAGIHRLKEYRRYYPEGESTAHVVGFTNIDEQGQEGIELTFNQLLQGTPGKQRVIKDRKGQIINVVEDLLPPHPGTDIKLTIDHRIQYLAYHELKKAVEESQAEAGSLVMLDVQTGEILAMANYPSYNPNRPVKKQDGRYRNRAVTDLFEPGSTIKGLSVANVLEQTHYTPESLMDTSPGWIVLNGRVVDDHQDNGEISLTRVLARSSNVGMSKFILETPANSLWELLHNLGFGEATGIDFPGEAHGVLTHHRVWAPFTLATLSFGYGLSSTNLQLAQAYGVVAADGMKRPLTIVQREGGARAEKQVLSPLTAQRVRVMLEAVVEKGGTGTRAQIKGYRVAGKTGTVRKVGRNGYEAKHHVGLFVGMVPADKPRIVTSVVIDDPKGKYYGGLVAAPVFAKVTAGGLRILGIPPQMEVEK